MRTPRSRPISAARAQAVARAGEHDLARERCRWRPTRRRPPRPRPRPRACRAAARACCRRRSSGRTRPSAARAARRARARPRSSALRPPRAPRARRASGRRTRRALWASSSSTKRGQAREEDRRLREACRLAGAREAVLADQLAGAARSSAGQRARDALARASDRHPLPGEQHRGAALHTHAGIIAPAGSGSASRRRRHPRPGGVDPPDWGVWAPRSAGAPTRSGRARSPAAPRRRGCGRRACGRACSCARGSCAARGAAPPRSRGWSSRAAIRSSTSRSRGESAGGRRRSAGWKTVMPSPTMRTARAMSAAPQSLGMKPDGAGRLRGARARSGRRR